MVTDPAELGTSAHYILNKEFHSAVLDGCGNTLVCIAAQPVFSVLQTRLRREQMPDSFARRLDDDHRAILEAIEAGDSDSRRRGDAQAHRVPQRRSTRTCGAPRPTATDRSPALLTAASRSC